MGLERAICLAKAVQAGTELIVGVEEGLEREGGGAESQEEGGVVDAAEQPVRTFGLVGGRRDANAPRSRDQRKMNVNLTLNPIPRHAPAPVTHTHTHPLTISVVSRDLMGDSSLGGWARFFSPGTIHPRAHTRGIPN